MNNEITHEQFLLLMGVMAALIAAIAPIMTAWVARKAAKRSELDRLTLRVDALEHENERLHRERIVLWEYIGGLRRILQEHDIVAPPMPKMEL